MYREKRSNELYHFGVKGMRWGVRRYQNEDGSLTPKGEKRYLNSDGSLTRKGQKRVAKLQKYRDRKARSAERHGKYHRAQASEIQETMKDLRKNRTKSEAYKKWAEKDDARRDEEYAKDYLYRNFMRDDFDVGTVPLKRDRYTKYSDSWQRDYLHGEENVKNLLNENKKEYQKTIKSAERWERNRQDLMDMPISITTTKNDIKSTYKRKDD